MAAKIKTGDDVQVLCGRSRGVKGKVLAVYPRDGRALVQGVNMVTRHQKQTQTSEGGIVKKESSIDLSNLALLDPKDGKPTRVGFRFDDDGKKTRYSKRSGEAIVDHVAKKKSS